MHRAANYDDAESQGESLGNLARPDKRKAGESARDARINQYRASSASGTQPDDDKRQDHGEELAISDIMSRSNNGQPAQNN